jgi:type I restriction enzyme M protein
VDVVPVALIFEVFMNNAEQQFLNELDNKFWKAADKLRANMDAANYKHVVLGSSS